jgi:choline dehydrogenase-like flavoprotein
VPFRISLGNEAWSATVGGLGGDPHITTLDFINGVNLSGLNENNSALSGSELKQTLGNRISRQFRIAFAVEQSPDRNNRVTLSSATDALGLRRPKIAYNLSDYTKQGIAAAFRLKKLIFDKLGVAPNQDFTKTVEDDPAAFAVDGINQKLTYGGAGHVMGTYRMGTDPKISVVDSFQRSHDHPNLYLVGSGTFPTVGTANPTITLSALALRTADSIAKALG